MKVLRLRQIWNYNENYWVKKITLISLPIWFLFSALFLFSFLVAGARCCGASCCINLLLVEPWEVLKKVEAIWTDLLYYFNTLYLMLCTTPSRLLSNSKALLCLTVFRKLDLSFQYPVHFFRCGYHSSGCIRPYKFLFHCIEGIRVSLPLPADLANVGDKCVFDFLSTFEKQVYVCRVWILTFKRERVGLLSTSPYPMFSRWICFILSRSLPNSFIGSTFF